MPKVRAPERTCVGCRGKGTKRGLVRIVRAPDGSVRVDPTGSAPGRGAYVHPEADCARAALAKGALSRALKVVVRPDEVARLRAEIEREAEDR